MSNGRLLLWRHLFFLGPQVSSDALNGSFLRQFLVLCLLREMNLKMCRYLMERLESACRFLFSQKINLQIEVIPPFRLAIHRVLTNQNEGGQKYCFKGKNCG